MNKLLPVLFFFNLIGLSAIAQQPPLLNTFTYTHDAYNLTTCITYTANDTGTITVQLQLAKNEVGNIVIDKYFYSSADSGGGCYTITTLEPCTNYRVTLNMSNSIAYGPVTNPLFLFKSDCVSNVGGLSTLAGGLASYRNAVFTTVGELASPTFLEVYDLTGRLVALEKLTSTQQSVPMNVNPGIYVGRIVVDGQTLLVNRLFID